jgi:hypothetical protein
MYADDYAFTCSQVCSLVNTSAPCRYVHIDMNFMKIDGFKRISCVCKYRDLPAWRGDGCLSSASLSICLPLLPKDDDDDDELIDAAVSSSVCSVAARLVTCTSARGDACANACMFVEI